MKSMALQVTTGAVVVPSTDDGLAGEVPVVIGKQPQRE